MSQDYSEAFMAAVDLCEAKNGDAKGKLWEYSFGDWCVKLNGSRYEEQSVPAFHCVIERRGLPAALLSPFAGIAMLDIEDQFIAAAKRESAA